MSQFFVVEAVSETGASNVCLSNICGIFVVYLWYTRCKVYQTDGPRTQRRANWVVKMPRGLNQFKALELLCLALFSLSSTAKHFVPDQTGTRWQYQLSDRGTVKFIPGVNTYIIDLDTAREEIPRLKTLDKGIRVICYYSAGTYEKARRKSDKDRGPYSFDPETYLRSAMLEQMADWPDETWLDVTNKRVWYMNKKRMQFAKEIGCDGVDPDNVDIYTVKGKAGSRKESAAFVRYLTEKAHDLGLGIGLKNAVELIEDVPDVDWYVNESCVTFGECGKYASVAAKKAVFAVEYCDAKKHLGETTQNPTCACSKARKHGLNMLIKRVDLDGDRMACDERLFVMVEFGDDCASESANVCSGVFES
jgi:hypothetical protein